MGNFYTKDLFTSNGSNTINFFQGKHYVKDTSGVLNQNNFNRIEEIPEVTKIPDFWGMNIHRRANNNESFDNIVDLGVKWARVSMSWATVETSLGVYNFTAFDDIFQKAAQNNIKMVVMLGYSNLLYETSTRHITTPEGIEAFGNFAKACVNRYNNANIVWEIWNEPNNPPFWTPTPNVNEYMTLATSVISDMRSTGQNLTIIAPATNDEDIYEGVIDLEFLQSCFDLGLLDIIDGLSLHTYCYPAEALEIPLQNLKTLMGNYINNADSFPIYATECGTSDYNKTQEIFSAYVQRVFLLSLYYNLKVNIWYDLIDDFGVHDLTGQFGMLTETLVKKQAFYDLQSLINNLDGYSYLGRVPSNELYFILLFGNGTNYKMSAWLNVWNTDEQVVVNICNTEYTLISKSAPIIINI